MVQDWRARTYYRSLLRVMWKEAKAREMWLCWTLHYDSRVWRPCPFEKGIGIHLGVGIGSYHTTLKCNPRLILIDPVYLECRSGSRSTIFFLDFPSET